MRYLSERSRAFSLILAGALCAAPDAFAQPGETASGASLDGAGLERARDAFRRGVALARERRHAEAVQALLESDALKPHPTTRYNAAVCLRELGQHARSYAAFASALDVAGEQPAPELVARVRQNLKEEAAALGAVNLAGAAPVTSARVDGASVVSVAAEGRERFLAGAEGSPASDLPPGSDLWMDAGEHVLVVQRRGEPERTFHVRVVAGAVERLELDTPPPPPLPASGRASAAPPPPLAVPAAAQPAPPEWVETPDRTWAYVSFGVGGAALVASGVFAALSLNEKSYLEPRCGENRVCPSEYADDKERMERYAAFATVGLAVGVAGVAAGTYLWLRPPTTRTDIRSGAGAQLRPFVGVLSAGVSGRF